MPNKIKQLFVEQLLHGDDLYRIPMYQRNYAWEEGEITQLIQDVIDYCSHHNSQHYYIGTLVVFERKDHQPEIYATMDGQQRPTKIYETIDGQQRLTTLSLLLSYLKNEGEPKRSWNTRQVLDFECRPLSQKTFSAIFNNQIDTLPAGDINPSILNGYRIIQKVLPQKILENKTSQETFSHYLLKHVCIMRVEVPHDTDLNHYFEIMNNRGEQLEKHEVLKSRMLEMLNRLPDEERQKSKSCFHRIWEACANMEKYIQVGFPPKQRKKVFDPDGKSFRPKNFKQVQDIISQEAEHKEESKSLKEILDGLKKHDSQNFRDEKSPERFSSVINFPNFLLHVLRVLVGKDVPLDDKRLIPIFEEKLLKHGTPEDVECFGYALLKCKYLYDHYILKREFIRGSDGWSLKRYKWVEKEQKDDEGAYYVNTFGDEEGQDDANRRILMLLAAFHVSAPTLVYKHWLSAALYWLYKTSEVNYKPYLDHLESVARSFVFDRFLGGRDQASYDQMTFEPGERVESSEKNLFHNERLDEKLSFGKIENNLVFNYLDYLLWLEHKDNSIIKAYEFTFRSSVEHYYPQHPLPGHAKLEEKVLHSFGNLCLLSHSKNARLSNFMPQAKKEYYKNNSIDSIKQYLMMQFDVWDKKAILEHGKDMKDVLSRDLEAWNEQETISSSKMTTNRVV